MEYHGKLLMNSKKRIILIDDEIIVGKTLSKVLYEEGYEVFCVTDGETAIDVINDDDFDLILLDLKLSGIDGIETLKAIRDKNSNIPVILVSGYLSIERVEEASKYGIFSYIRKPFKIEDVRMKVNRALKSKKSVTS